MEKPKSNFPWYFIYTPIVTAIVAIGYWSVATGDVPMDILDRILNWLNVNDRAAAVIAIVCLALIGVGYMIARWYSTNVRLKKIESVANSAPADISQHIDTASQTVFNSIQSEKNELTEKLATIRTTTDNMAQQINFLTAHRNDVPIQQDQFMGGISSLYALHDKQAQIILDLTEKLRISEEKNAKLTLRLKKAERRLQQYEQDSPDWPD